MYYIQDLAMVFAKLHVYDVFPITSSIIYSSASLISRGPLK